LQLELIYWEGKDAGTADAHRLLCALCLTSYLGCTAYLRKIVHQARLSTPDRLVVISHVVAASSMGP
jgi:hypothetical protein